MGSVVTRWVRQWILAVVVMMMTRMVMTTILVKSESEVPLASGHCCHGVARTTTFPEPVVVEYHAGWSKDRDIDGHHHYCYNYYYYYYDRDLPYSDGTRSIVRVIRIDNTNGIGRIDGGGGWCRYCCESS